MSDFNTIREVVAWLASGEKGSICNNKFIMRMNEAGYVVDQYGNDWPIRSLRISDFKKVIEPIKLTLDSYVNEDGLFSFSSSQKEWIKNKLKDKIGTGLRIKIEEVK